MRNEKSNENNNYKDIKVMKIIILNIMKIIIRM